MSSAISYLEWKETNDARLARFVDVTLIESNGLEAKEKVKTSLEKRKNEKQRRMDDGERQYKIGRVCLDCVEPLLE